MANSDFFLSLLLWPNGHFNSPQNNPEMEKTEQSSLGNRREFLGTLATSAAALGLSSLATLQAEASPEIMKMAADADAWFEKIKGKHRVVFDVPQPHEVFPFAWPRVFMVTNVATGTPENEQGVVVVLRHSAIPYAMDSNLWEKYKFGEVFKIDDPKTKAPSIRNMFWKPAEGDYKIPGVGPVKIGINELMESGVMFCVCDMAMTVYSNALAQGGDPANVKKDFLAGLLPGVQPVPSGVWALGRAQEKKCAYIFAG
jgi:intracellular sulfur oxidation DsrE/DsrF family protein